MLDAVVVRMAAPGLFNQGVVASGRGRGGDGGVGVEELAQPVEVALVEATAQGPDRALQFQMVGHGVGREHVRSYALAGSPVAGQMVRAAYLGAHCSR